MSSAGGLGNSPRPSFPFTIWIALIFLFPRNSLSKSELRFFLFVICRERKGGTGFHPWREYHADIIEAKKKKKKTSLFQLERGSTLWDPIKPTRRSGGNEY